MRRTALLAATVLALAACDAEAGSGQAGVRSATAGERWATDFSRHTVPLDEIVPGGPPKDGIPALDDPSFVGVDEADAWLEDREPVVVVEHDGAAKAYPYQVLIWHEIVNDDVGGLALAVTYCPLCNTALVFRRERGGRLLDFGTTGRLRHSDLVMYDRQTESWWQQATGEAIVLASIVITAASVVLVLNARDATFTLDRVLGRTGGSGSSRAPTPEAPATGAAP